MLIAGYSVENLLMTASDFSSKQIELGIAGYSVENLWMTASDFSSKQIELGWNSSFIIFRIQTRCLWTVFLKFFQ